MQKTPFLLASGLWFGESQDVWDSGASRAVGPLKFVCPVVAAKIQFFIPNSPLSTLVSLHTRLTDFRSVQILTFFNTVVYFLVCTIFLKFMAQISKTELYWVSKK